MFHIHSAARESHVARNLHAYTHLLSLFLGNQWFTFLAYFFCIYLGSLILDIIECMLLKLNA